ncbi:HTH-type transcriptional regulator MalT [Streptomyces sp. SudanB66_2053]
MTSAHQGDGRPAVEHRGPRADHHAGHRAETHGSADPHDPHGDPFLRTRFAVPAPPDTFLCRQRLARHLDGALRTPLTLVNGCAGAGKTLLVADWVTGRPELPVAWLTTDTDGQGAGMFWAYLLQALCTSGVPLPPDIAFPADANRVGDALPARLAALLSGRDRPVVLVLDEFDRVTAPEIAAQLEFLLRHSAPGLRLVLVTRTEPLLPLHRYRAAGEVTEIRDAELAFTPGEAARLMEAHGLRLSPAAVRGIVERTRGWAAGLRLCALAAEDAPDPELCLKEFEADRSAVADFLLAEVLKRQDAATQELLLRVSVLDRFGPRPANAVTGRADAEAVLARLHRSNAFVQHVGHGVYRLHPLFAEILRAHLRMRRPGLEPSCTGGPPSASARPGRSRRRSGTAPPPATGSSPPPPWWTTSPSASSSPAPAPEPSPRCSPAWGSGAATAPRRNSYGPPPGCRAATSPEARSGCAVPGS